MRTNRSPIGLTVALAFFSVALLAGNAWPAIEFKTLHTFTDGNDGGFPLASVIFDGSGALYGTTESGGVYGWGTVFKLTRLADGRWTEKVLHEFTGGEDGGYPTAELIFDQAGNLYGTTSGGGLAHCGHAGCGVAFRLTPNLDGSWYQKVLYQFTEGADGGVPLSGLTFDQAGNLYGTAVFGGNGAHCGFPQDVGCGVVFKLTPKSNGSWTESVLHTFCSLAACHDGMYPLAGLIFDQAGNLYGTTQNGGIVGQCGGPGCGVVFRLTPTSRGPWKERVLHYFTGGKDGAYPGAGLIFGADGSLYGTTLRGGAVNYCPNIGCGVVFRLTSNQNGSWTEGVLRTFTGGRDGGIPAANLIFDQTGNLYGTTSYGGNPGLCGGLGCGTVFKLTPNSGGRWREEVLHSFFDHPGAIPVAGIIFDAAGILYGTTSGDIRNTHGSVFEITP